MIFPTSLLALAIVLAAIPLSWVSNWSDLALLVAISVILIGCAYHQMRSWLIVLAAVLSLAPAFVCLYVLFLRSIGIHAYLTAFAYSPESQRDSLLLAAGVYTIIFVLCLCAGWLLAGGSRAETKCTPRLASLSAPVLWLLFFIWAVCILGQFRELGGVSILSAQYGSRISPSASNFGMFAVIANLSLLIVELSDWGRRNRRRLNAFWLVGSFSFFMLGDRVDVLAALLLLLLTRVSGFQRQRRVLLLGTTIVVPLFIFWGFYRQVAAFDLHQDHLLADFASNSLEKLPTIGGLGPITLTTTDSIYLRQTGRLAPLHGLGYLDYIPRTLPRFLFPNRPESLATLFWRYGLPTVGGLTPVAEALLNFNHWALIPIAALIGLLLARLEAFGRTATIPWRRGLYAVAVAISFRTWLYEVFTLYKAMVGFLLLAAVIYGLQALWSQHSVGPDKKQEAAPSFGS